MQGFKIDPRVIEAVEFHTAALPGATVYYSSSGLDALILPLEEYSIIHVDSDGDTHEAPLGEWSTGHEV